MLKSKGYDVIDEDEEYKYLVKMAMDSVTSENVEKLLKEVDGKQTELHIVKSTTIQQMWLQELGELEEEYIKYRLDRERALEDKVVAKSKKVVKSQSAKKKEPTDFIID
jgi:DNA-binding protein H-NS